ncbi:Methyl-CpG binding transcription regulator [Handroanthus impetiginosus]|uniref:Methyl-CpG binding transcription regulator n=1 Tax=Handroanthus impetiginosus TaxID=429701 RepID=A0A2G9H0I5_9LAMI|nr:Methyl-CpG binding transcription regulator [Handroanthus impetiginosus]
MGGEHPDWLPVGWKVSVKIRSCGRKDKYYVNPSNGLKFNSKPEVLRYLKTSGIDRKPKDPSKIDIKKTVAEKLPPGWIKEIRTKKKGGKTRRDPYYIDPFTGRYFRSMQEVFRYLESNDSRKAETKPDDKGRINVDLGDHSQSVSRLLSSAEAKGRKLVDKKVDKTSSAHESVKSGPKLNAGSKCAATNNANVPEDIHLGQTEQDDSLAIELSDKLQLVNKKQYVDRTREFKKSADNKVDKHADEDQRLKSGMRIAAPKRVNMHEVNIVEQRDRENDSVSKNLPDKLQEINGREEHKYRRRQSKRLADIKPKDNITKDQSLQSGLEGAPVKNINVLETNGLEQREKDNNSVGEGPQDKILVQRNKRKDWTSELPRRTSKRLARVEVDPLLEVKTNNKAEAEVNTTKSIGKEGPVDEPKTDNVGKSGSLNSPNEHHSERKTENPATIKPEKPVTPPVEEHKEEEHDKRPNSSLKDLLMDPCIEFAIKTLTGAIPIDDVKKVGDSPVSSLASPNQTSASSSMVPPDDIWTDPCFEFAVKTLTGEMPMEKGPQLQVTFQQPLSSAGPTGCNGIMLPKIRLDNIYPSNYSFGQFNDVKKPSLRQEAVRDPPFPRGMNGGSKNFHHSVEGEGGTQCRKF